MFILFSVNLLEGEQTKEIDAKQKTENLVTTALCNCRQKGHKNIAIQNAKKFSKQETNLKREQNPVSFVDFHITIKSKPNYPLFTLLISAVCEDLQIQIAQKISFNRFTFFFPK